jgi:hypothetical protein
VHHSECLGILSIARLTSECRPMPTTARALVNVDICIVACGGLMGGEGRSFI